MSRYFQVCKETSSSITSRVGRGGRVRYVGGNFYAKMCEARVHLHFASFLQGHTHTHTQHTELLLSCFRKTQQIFTKYH